MCDENGQGLENFVLEGYSCVPGGPFQPDQQAGGLAALTTRTFSEYWTRADAYGKRVSTFSTLTPSSNAADKSSTLTSNSGLVTHSTSDTMTWPAVAAVAEALSRWSATPSR